MSYRIELSPNNRANCSDTVCKAAADKCTKGTLRFGTWFVLPQSDHGSWKWKHWGCVSGFQLCNVRDAVQEEEGKFNWDLLDGYDELSDHPDLQAKIRRCVEQGHIDPEDFRGDPKFNVPGSKGIRGRAKVTKLKAEVEGGDEEEEEQKPKAKAAASKKGAKGGRKKAGAKDDEEVEAEQETEAPKKKGRGRKKAEVDEEDEEAEPPKKKGRARKSNASVAAKEEPEEEEEEEPAKPAAKKGARASLGKSKDTPIKGEVESDEKPVKNGRGGRKSNASVVPKEEESDSAPVAEPKQAAKRKRGVAKQAEADEQDDEKPAPVKKARGRPRKSDTVVEPVNDDEASEVEEDSESKPEPAKRGRKPKAAAAAPKKTATKEKTDGRRRSGRGQNR
ncbi:hypothetical protein PgNI_10759 [Pyricularia grisea]|uniref:PARP-type domain-containing protein n=1 Tax=Pyricularia grisea TaxID=148305 RepID=A0A6P8AZJ8_PYRGI|nr:hypothetical protein PgNI_10759 [Pyricularia grisea]TLD07750.1 hypothetical protein PgNI_10759 [Pyricularia grisea]